MVVVLVVDAVDDPRENGLVQGLAVLLQPFEQDLLLDRDGVEGVPPSDPLKLLKRKVRDTLFVLLLVIYC